jgi:hypothetical protein
VSARPEKVADRLPCEARFARTSTARLHVDGRLMFLTEDEHGTEEEDGEHAAPYDDERRHTTARHASRRGGAA